MDSIFVLISYLSYIAVLSVTFYAINNYLALYKAKSSKTEIANLQAKVVTLKMALRARIKMKLKSFRSRFVNPVNKGDTIDNALTALKEIRFETANDFQNYFEVSKKINYIIDTDLKGSSNYSAEVKEQKFEDFMGPDYKNEIAIIRILKEITDASEKLNKKIEIYNNANVKNKKFEPIKKVESLIFPALADVNRVFRDSEKLIKEMQKEDPDLFKSAS